MSFVRNRELSQFGSFLYIDNTTQNIGITTTGTPYVGIGTDNPTSLLTVGGNVDILGTTTAEYFAGDGSGLYNLNIPETYWIKNASGIHTTSNVGIKTTNPQTPLQIENVYGVKTGSGTFTASAGIPYTIDSFDISSTNFKTADYIISVGYGTHIQSQKVLVMQNRTNAYSQEYAIMYHSNLIVSIASTISSGLMILNMIPEAGVSGITTYRFVRNTLL